MIKENPYSVSIVIPSYNTRYLLEKNLPRVLEAAKNPKNFIKEVIVVDDGSKDDSAIFVRKNFPEIRLIKHKINRGFAAAFNTGVRMSKGNFVVLLNSDVFPQTDFLEKALPFLEKNLHVFAVSFHEKGRGWARVEFEEGFVVHKPGKEDVLPHPTFFVNAGGAIYRRNIWIRLGGMDEALYSPFYWGDIDISYRALKRGFMLYWHPDAYVSPSVSATVAKLPKQRVVRIQQRNHLLFIWKNLTSPNLFRKHILGLLEKIIRHPGYLIVLLMAIRKLKTVAKARKKERKEGKISDEAIFARLK